MRFSSAIFVVAATTAIGVIALPAAAPGTSCAVLNCAIELSGLGFACGGAVAQAGLDPLSDASCILAAATSLGPSLPADCHCSQQAIQAFVKSKQVAKKVETKVVGTAKNVAPKVANTAVKAEKKVEGTAKSVVAKAGGLFKSIF